MSIRWDLKKHLRRRKWTGYRLAKEAGLTPSTVYKILKKGDLTEIDVATLEKLAAALNQPPFMLLAYTPTPD